MAFGRLTFDFDEGGISPRLVLRNFKGSSWQKSIVGIDWLRDLANFSGKTNRETK